MRRRHRNPYVEAALTAVPEPEGPERRTGAPAAGLPGEAGAREIHDMVRDELGICDQTSITVEQLRRDHHAAFHGMTVEDWHLMATSRLGRVADDLMVLRDVPTRDRTRRRAHEALLQLSAIAQILATEILDPPPAA